METPLCDITGGIVVDSVVFAIVTAFVAATISSLAMIAGHYLTPKLKGSDMSAMANYTYGLLGIILPYGGWLALFIAEQGPNVPAGLAFAVLLIVVIGAGSGTAVAHGADRYFSLRAQEHVNHREPQP